MSIPRNNAAPPPPDATPAAGAFRRRAVMVGNLLASSGLFFFAACADRGLTEPAAPAAAQAAARAVPEAAVPSDRGFARAVATPAWGITTQVRGDTLVEQFTYVAGEGLVVQSGRGHMVLVPAGAICDPATSGYGPAAWGKACAPAKANIRFTMRSWTGRDGSANLTFAPDVRFAPDKTVLLEVKRPATAAPASAAGPIQWCTTAMTNCVDESLTDKSLGTSFDPFASTAWRRIKHFSGFHTGFGKVQTRVTSGGA